MSGEVAGVRRPARKVPVAMLLVDTGSEFSRLPGPLLRRVGVTVAKKGGQFFHHPVDRTAVVAVGAFKGFARMAVDKAKAAWSRRP